MHASLAASPTAFHSPGIKTPASTASPIKKWCHQNPSLIKAATVATGVFGAKSLCEGLYNLSLSRIVLGASILAGACLLDKILPIIIPPAFNPVNRAFKEGVCRGVTLHYEGNLPLLDIPNGVTPFDAGYAQGFMMAEQIKEIVARNEFAFHTLKGLPRHVPHLIEKIKETIPAEYLTEMEGLAAGYNAQRAAWTYFKGCELTIDKILYLHLLPDNGNLDFTAGENWAARHPDVMGCTVVVDGDVESGPIFARTVDWIPMQVYGRFSYVLRRESKSGIRTVGQSFPMFVGCLTAMNEHGFTVAMNVTKGLTSYPIKPPAVFFLRQLVENCTCVVGEDSSAGNFLRNNSPLGAFNLTVCDAQRMASVHLYQSDNGSHFVRPWQPGTPLITLNYRYGEQGENNPTASNSLERQVEIEDKYATWSKQGIPDFFTRLQDILSGPEVNNIRTTGAAVIHPKERTFKFSFDNGYAGDRSLIDVPTLPWFRRT